MIETKHKENQVKRRKYWFMCLKSPELHWYSGAHMVFSGMTSPQSPPHTHTPPTGSIHNVVTKTNTTATSGLSQLKLTATCPVNSTDVQRTSVVSEAVMYPSSRHRCHSDCLLLMLGRWGHPVGTTFLREMYGSFQRISGMRLL